MLRNQCIGVIVPAGIRDVLSIFPISDVFYFIIVIR